MNLHKSLRSGALLLVCAVVAFSSPALAKFKAVTTFTIIADMAQNVAEDATLVESAYQLHAALN